MASSRSVSVKSVILRSAKRVSKDDGPVRAASFEARPAVQVHRKARASG